MNKVVTIIAIILLTNWFFQIFYAWNARYCDIIDWSFQLLGFKIGCILSGLL